MTPRDRDPDPAEVERLADLPGKLAFLRTTERLGEDERRAWREARVAEVLAAAQGSPFWAPRTAGVARLEDLPLLDRETLQEEFEGMRVPGRGPVVEKRTSGSTGRPVRVEHGPATVGYAAAARMRQRAWFGLPAAGELPQANMRIAALPGEPPVARVRDDPPQFAVNPFELERGGLGEVHQTLVAAGGVRLIGAESSLFGRWAELYRGSGLDARELGVELGIVGGEMTFAGQKELVRATFGCAVAEMYGSHEALMMACECPEGSLHLNEEVVALEVLDGDGRPCAPGELGEVVVTLLHNVEFPLLRYRLGDVARTEPGPCPCGRTLGRLALEIGRLEEMVRTRAGGLLHPRFLRTTYERVFGDALRAFHTVQEDFDRFTVHADLAGPASADAGPRLEAELAGYVGEPVSVRVETGAGLDRLALPSGKRRTFTSELPAGRA